MKQRTSVRALIRENTKTLLLRRANGRQSIIGQYELPGGKIAYGEQPEDALARYLREDAGLNVKSSQLFDVISYIDHDDRDIQYTLIVYVVSLGEGGSRVLLGENYNDYLWAASTQLPHGKLTESTRLLLDIAVQRVEKRPDGRVIIDTQQNPDASTPHLIIYSDGGSRGNPGPSASGYVIMNDREEVLHQGGGYLGITTNNQAEYSGVRFGLEKALKMGATSIDFRLDSLLVVNQLNGLYDIKNRDLWPIHERVKELITHFDSVTFTHVRREFNQLADGMVNKILNAHAEQD